MMQIDIAQKNCSSSAMLIKKPEPVLLFSRLLGMSSLYLDARTVTMEVLSVDDT